MKVFQINRVVGEHECMRISAVDDGVVVLRVEITLEQMMRALTGQAIVVKNWVASK